MSERMVEIRAFIANDLLAAIDGQIGSDEVMLGYLKDKLIQAIAMVAMAQEKGGANEVED